jgi:hypothetical protein
MRDARLNCSFVVKASPADERAIRERLGAAKKKRPRAKLTNLVGSLSAR